MGARTRCFQLACNTWRGGSGIWVRNECGSLAETESSCDYKRSETLKTRLRKASARWRRSDAKFVDTKYMLVQSHPAEWIREGRESINPPEVLHYEAPRNTPFRRWWEKVTVVCCVCLPYMRRSHSCFAPSPSLPRAIRKRLKLLFLCQGIRIAAECETRHFRSRIMTFRSVISSMLDRLPSAREKIIYRHCT